MLTIKNNWQTQLTILWWGQALLMAVLVMSLPYWPLYLDTLEHFTREQLRFWSAAIYIAPFLSAIFSSPLWGNLGDRYGHKKMVIRACLGLFITQTLILCTSNIYLILIFRLLQGVLANFIVTAQTWALNLCPETARGVTIGKLQSATAVGNLFGPLLGGFIATYAGYIKIFSISSVICALVTIVFMLTLVETKTLPPKHEQVIEKFSFKNIFYLQQFILTLLGTIIILQLARSIITPIFALFVTEKLGGNDIMVGLLYAATGIMIFISAPRWGKYFDSIIHQFGKIKNKIILLLILCAFLQLLQAYVANVYAVLVLRLLWGICLGGLLPQLLRLLADTNNKQQGVFLGLGDSATKLGNLLGIILGALIENHLGYTATFLMTASCYFIAAFLIIYKLKPHENLAQGTFSNEAKATFV